MIENNVVLAANSSPSSGELLDLLERRPGIRTSLKQVATIREIMGSGIAAASQRHCIEPLRTRMTSVQICSSCASGTVWGSHPTVRFFTCGRDCFAPGHPMALEWHKQNASRSVSKRGTRIAPIAQCTCWFGAIAVLPANRFQPLPRMMHAKKNSKEAGSARRARAR